MAEHDKQQRDVHSNTPTRLHLLSILSDGRYHSGNELGECLAMSRTAVWKQIQRLSDMGLDIFSVKGRGYQLQNPPELLREERIQEYLAEDAKDVLSSLDIYFETTSTSDRLLQHLERETIHGHIVLAEYQSQGRGRRGTNWVSPPASGIYLSLGWHYHETPNDLGCLSLAIGVAIVRALEGFGLQDIGLKWPNDIYWQGKKLGGILVESRGEHGGPCDIVLGLGLNVCIPEKQENEIDQAWVDLATINKQILSRNQLVAEILNEIISLLSAYADQGFQHYIEAWRKLDCASGKKALLTTINQTKSGRVIGIDDQGLLLMSVDGYIERFMSGQISFKVEE